MVFTRESANLPKSLIENFMELDHSSRIGINVWTTGLYERKWV
jgi:hypothetical protein